MKLHKWQDIKDSRLSPERQAEIQRGVDAEVAAMQPAKPILFSTAMVQALLAGTKSQTRRIMNPQPQHAQVYDWKGHRLYDGESRQWCWKGHVEGGDYLNGQLHCFRDASPYGAVGGKLWVRESWALVDGDTSQECLAFRATDPDPTLTKWKPSIHMPRTASRITLTLTDVRVQRLHDISEEDAKAEGCERAGGTYMDGTRPGTFRAGYAFLWDRINGAGAWDANPWIWALSFSVEVRS